MSELSGLSVAQSVVLVSLSTTSATLSLFGSFTIIRYAQRRARKDLYHRLVLLLSVIDIIVSTTIILQPWLVPQEGGYRWSFGNTRTCSMLGFFMRFPLGVAFINCYLSLFFMTKICYGKGDTDLSRYEMPALVAAFALPVIFGISGLVTESFNTIEMFQICDFGPYPAGCDSDSEVDCIRGRNYLLQDWIYTSFLFIATILAVYGTVRIALFTRTRL
jgi:hypothetical protein